MAITCTFEATGSVASTTNASSYASNAFTPVANDLIVVFVVQSANVAAGSMTDSQSLGFTRVSTQALFATSAGSVQCFIANALAAASSMTVTYATSGGAATGCILLITRLAGMQRLGLNALLQVKNQDNIATASTPAPAFTSSVKTGNATLGAVANGVSPATMTPPTSWTEGGDLGYATPTIGGESIFRNSGFTGTTVTWGSVVGGALTGGALIVEIDATNFFTKALTATFTPTAALTKQINHLMTATFTPTGALVRFVSHLMTATFSPTGALVRFVNKTAFAATQSFVGALAASKLFVRAFTATLNFTGALQRQTGKALAATFSPTGALTRATNKLLPAATLNFAGVLTRNIRKQLAASLSFVAALATQFTSGGPHVVNLTATLNFVGGMSLKTNKTLAATLSFVGALTKNLPKAFTATLSDIGSLTRRTNKPFTAGQSFSVAINRRTAKALTATISFVGAFSQHITGTVHLSFNAALAFTGALQKRTRKGLSAQLGFIGSLTSGLFGLAKIYFHNVTKSVTVALKVSKSVFIKGHIK